MYKSLYNISNKCFSASKKCFYKVLNVSTEASTNEIKQSYLKLAKKYHPDANIESSENEVFKEINEAYHVLSDDLKRKQYNSTNGLKDEWKYSKMEDFEQSNINNEEEEELKQNLKDKNKYSSQYFENKYFKNKDYFRKNLIDDNEFELTFKLYKTHKQEITEKKKDYIEFFPQMSSAYFVHKDEEQRASEQNTVKGFLYEFRYILGLVGVLTVSYKIYMREEGKKQVLGGKDI